jgi:hypothetical protein
MAKLPYTFTICPDGPEPTRFTASCPEMGQLLKDSPNGDLTIDDRRRGMWQSWSNRPIQAKPLEERIVEAIDEVRKSMGEK